MPSIRSRQVACAEWPDIRRFEHFLQLLDIVNDAFNIHPSQYLTEKRPRSMRSSTLETATAQFRPDPIRRRPMERCLCSFVSLTFQELNHLPGTTPRIELFV